MRKLPVARITRAHGVRGELRASLFNRESELLLGRPPIWLSVSGGEFPYRILGARRANEVVLLALEGVEDRDRAEALRGALVLVERDVLPAPAEDEVYLADLVGLRVEGPDGPLGVVREIQCHPTVEVALVVDDAGTARELVLSGPWVGRIDVEAGVVMLTSLEGFLEQPEGTPRA